ncbi:MAG: cytochrome P450 [Pseudomonadota bacterium]
MTILTPNSPATRSEKTNDAVSHDRLPPSYSFDAATGRLELDTSDPLFVQNPYPAYADLHKRSGPDGPIVWWDAYGHHVFGGLDTVNALFRNRKLGRQILHRVSREELGWPPPNPRVADFDAVDAHSLLELEPPDHTRLRKLIARAFISRQIETLGPEIEAEADHAMDRFGETADLIADYAQPLAGNTIARMLGIDTAHVPALLNWSNAMVRMYAASRNEEVERAANSAAREFAAFVWDEIEARRRHPGTDLLSHLLTVQADSDQLTDTEIVSTTILLLNAGHEATVHAMGNGLRILFQADNAMRQTWLADPQALVEEIVRHAPPLHMFTRYVLEDCELYGLPLRQGDVVGLHLGMANHDPRRIDNPSAFDPARPRVPHVAFGGGLHVCIGNALAKLEMQIAISRLFARFPALAMQGSARFKDAYHFHGLERLIVTTR